ncbi:UbiH/UbiF/VisC/COQ6 family ubiquinone biosynthesis hydroxylase [Acidomonas methanolica]|uniref:UbiH/UbiF/VisC/COQ6 family ubiquinone biosynthesis hydroxylase n=1 Tax=Acidomonas methanolica TaxID=437 RepID=UPI00211A9A80|nr:UbiH/UbiF/VisC/COQ6 family ubiquinone biosynthesis hydroxylase [Acidomonas methanolica]MCQ9155647.1 UbiH/UbiF/VisC/COQ6 family ubiquinone biosynthesis hydroxylase [Acidomonas methanolica]
MSTSAATAAPRTIDIAVNGGGPVGATLACRLAHAGLRTLLIERAPLHDLEDPSLDGRAYALSEGSRRMMVSAGLWSHLPRPAQPITEILVRDGKPHARPSPWTVEFTQAEADGPFGWMVEARDLRRALNAALSETAAAGSLLLRSPATGRFTFAPDHVAITLDTGETFTAALAVAAEGRKSPLRDQARIPLTRLPYNQCGIISIIAHEKPHDGRALEHFLPQGPFARLPLSGTDDHPNRSAIVWAESARRAPRLHALPDDVFIREIAARLGDDEIGAFHPTGRRWIYPLSAQFAQRYIASRLALAGDSAHGLHPIAGQGLNAGFRDIAILAEILENAVTEGLDPGGESVLTSYQRRARPQAMLTLAACDGLERLFGNDNPALRLARDLGLGALNRMPGLKRAFVRRAMGL